MKKAYLIVVCLCFSACLTNVKTKKFSETLKNNGAINNTVNITKHPPLINKISQLNEDTCSIQWYGGGLFSLCFKRNKVSFFFTPQCIYWYKTKLENNKLIFFWAYNADCVFELAINKGYGVKKEPKVNSPFGEFVLVNDTTLQVKYYYPDWVKKVNEMGKEVDTLFPSIFIMKRK
jgi:hypothetical protein